MMLDKEEKLADQRATKLEKIEVLGCFGCNYLVC